MAVNKRDYYEVLGVNRSSSEQDLKSAYRRLAHQYHPDKNRNDPQAEEKFKEAAEAYAVLSDAEQRRRYDRFGHAGVSSAASAAWGAPGFGGFEDILGDLFGFGDVFGAGARAGGRRSAAHRGADLRSGVETGSRLRLQSEGESGAYGGPAGDLYVVIHVAEHEQFERQGNNLYASVPISFAQAALGSEIQVRTLDNEQSLKVPAGTQTGTVFRVRGKGMPVLGGRGRGDLFVAVSVVTPTMLTREQRKVLEQLAKIETPDLEDKRLVDKVRDIFG